MSKQMKILNPRDSQLILDKLRKGKRFLVTSDKAGTSLNANTASLDEVANVLVSLIKELQAKGIL